MLLEEAGYRFRCLDPGPDGPAVSDDPEKRVLAHSEFKAHAGALAAPEAWVLASDTLVWCAGEFLPKPQDQADARRMLETLAEAEHQVWTGVCLIGPEKQVFRQAACSRVRFSAIPADQLEAYLAGTEWADKAGAYGIQGTAGAWCELVEGDMDTVIGFPMKTVRGLLSRSGACLRGEAR